MNIKFLGTGGAFDFAQGNAAAIVETEKGKVLIDCGFSTLPKLIELNLVKDIDYILITHLHGDHIGGLPTLMQYLNFVLHKTIPIIVPSTEFASKIDQLLKITFADNKVVYEPIAGFSNIGYIDTTGQHGVGIISHAYYFTEHDHLIYYSGDIGNAQTAKNFLRDRTEQHIQVFHETTHRTDMENHTSYQEIQTKLVNYETYVYHTAKEKIPKDCALKLVEDYREFLC